MASPSTHFPENFQGFIFFTAILCVFAVSAGAQPPANHSGFPRLSATQQAELLLLNGKFEDAIQTYQKLWDEDDKNNHAVRGLVRAYWAAGRSKDLEKSFGDYISKHLRLG